METEKRKGWKKLVLPLVLVVSIVVIIVMVFYAFRPVSAQDQIKNTIYNWYGGLNDYNYDEVYSQESLIFQQGLNTFTLEQLCAGLEDVGFTCQVVSITNIVSGESLGGSTSGGVFATATVILKTNNGVETETPTLIHENGNWKIYNATW